MAVLVDPDDATHRTWYAGSVSGGKWETTDAGASEQSLSDNLPNLSGTALAMADSDIIYMGTGEGCGNVNAVSGAGIFKSLDRGRTLTQLEEKA